ncbi:MAG: tRNA (adenosine(37)-N6)-threonylcarbamoyltransferase complex ATPase subunit type 1 TsaE [Bacillota bacterium]
MRFGKDALLGKSKLCTYHNDSYYCQNLGAMMAGAIELETRSNSAEETRMLGERLGRLLQSGDVVALQGDLGAGKTCFTQGVARGLGVAGRVTSPTFVLIREYEGRLPLYHFDAYRLTGPEDLLALGSDDYFEDAGVSVVEWAEHVAAALPQDRLEIELLRVPGEEESRLIRFRATGPRAKGIVEELRRDLHPGD